MDKAYITSIVAIYLVGKLYCHVRIITPHLTLDLSPGSLP
ncbi:unnamed protein product, partial [marine sediment metagenome]